jgi:mRNA-degrading endonuclease toxin of MazEF toxin-antitoxin module
VRRGEIYHSTESLPARGDKAGFYVIVSRDFVASREEIDTVVCSPIYSRILGVRSEVIVGTAEGLPWTSAVRCDFTTLIFKHKLRGLVGSLPAEKMVELNAALRYALALNEDPPIVIS